MTVRSFLRRGSDKTRLIGRGILSPMRDRVPVFLGSCVMLAVLTLGACQPASVQRRGVPKASAASAEGQLGALRGSWPYRPGAQQSFYVFEQRAVLTSASDTVSRIDSVSSRTEVAFAFSAAGKTVTGMVTAFRVQGQATAAPRGLVLPFPFSGMFSGPGGQLLLIAPAAAACVTPSLPIVQSLRDLWFQTPDTLRLGTAWADSASYSSCRDGIPFGIVSRRQFHVSAVTEREGHVFLTLARTSTTAVEGEGTQSGEPVSLAGSGHGKLTYLLDVEGGKIVWARGSNTLEVTLRNKLRTQLVRQVGELQVDGAP